jgi:serine/threonine protein kinase
LQHVPAGVSLNRLLGQRHRPWPASLALAIGRGIADGVATLHAAEVSAGTLRGPSIWLTDDGEVLLLGHGLTQLPYTTQTYYGLPSEAPPEEYGTAMAPQVQGDAFRLGQMVCQLATGMTPVSRMTPVEYLQRTWTAELDAELGGLAPLLQAESVDRPRGELLRTLLDALAPADRKSLVAEAVEWSRGNPELQW